MSNLDGTLTKALKEGLLFSEEALSKLPTVYYTTDEEFAAILSTHDTHGNNWLNSLHIAVNLLERNENDKARKFFEMSLKAKPTPLAYRGLALVTDSRKSAWTCYETAWKILHRNYSNDPSFQEISTSLCREICFFLSMTGESWIETCQSYIDKLPSELREHEKACIDLNQHIEDMINKKEFDTVRQALQSEYAGDDDNDNNDHQDNDDDDCYDNENDCSSDNDGYDENNLSENKRRRQHCHPQ